MNAISVVIPCREETQGLILDSISKLRRALRGFRLDILVVENGSSLLHKTPGFRYYRIKEGGLGLALKLGISKAKFENVFFLPADMSFDLSFVRAALRENSDMVLGSKLAEGSVVNRPLKRKIISRIYSWKTRFVDGVHAKDVTGPKLYKKSRVVPLLGACRSTGIHFEVELEQQAEMHNLRVKEIPVTVRDYRESKILHWGPLGILRDLYFRFRERGLGKLSEKEFQRYLMVGLVGIFLFEGAFFALNQFVPYWASYLISFEAVTLINFLMHDSITFRHKKHYSAGKRFIIFQSQSIIYRIIQYTVFFTLSLFINLYVALLIAIFIAFVYSYSVNKRITWKAAKSESQD